MDHWLYSAYEANRALSAPSRLGSAVTLKLLQASPPSVRENGLVRHLTAASSVVVGAQLTHTRPRFGTTDDPLLGIDGEPVAQVVEDETPFASLLHFAQPGATGLPKVLIAAPMSGHFATMLTPTVRTMLRDHDVYITDWHNARDIPLEQGRFGLDEYVDHLVRFLRAMAADGSDVHLFAVCQPGVPAVMATAALAAEGDAAQPRTLTLMASPIDTRANPTLINKLAYKQPLSWYRRCTTTVPWRYAGRGRAVYPGFLQVGGFMSLNMSRHLKSGRDIYRSIASGQSRSSRRAREFYAEYYAVLDMSADFYLETVERIFQKDLLAKGELTYRGRPVQPGRVTGTALLTIEAENDELCAPGQTRAAHELFSGLEPGEHAHHLQAGVGHYGVFAGSKWTNDVYPVLRDFVHRDAVPHST
ncbi:polyhydroxyalkanoate depolymerase [Jatrophihabitans fulvus]